MMVSDRFWDFYFQKKKPDWALGAKEGEAGARPPSEGPPAEVEAWEDVASLAMFGTRPNYFLHLFWTENSNQLKTNWIFLK